MLKYVVIVYFCLFLPTSTASYVAPEPPKAPRTILELINDSAMKYGVKASVMHTVIKCESGYNPNAVGDFGKSYGLVQIHLPSHPEISKAQALDREFAIDFLAKKLSTHQGRMWTCFRIFFSFVEVAIAEKAIG